MTSGEPHPGATLDPSEPELMDDGQEEVFSHTAVEQGFVKDPTALDPATFAPRDLGEIPSPAAPAPGPPAGR